MKSLYSIIYIGSWHTAAIKCTTLLPKNNFDLTYSEPAEIDKHISQNTDLIIIDSDNINNDIICNIIKKYQNKYPFIFVASYENIPDTKGYDIIFKPLQKDELIWRINRCINTTPASDNIEVQELRNTLAARDQLYSTIAHDLKSPIATVKMLLKAVILKMDKEKCNSDIIEMITMCDKTSENIFLLLDNLLKWARVKTNRLMLNIQQFDLAYLAEDVRESMNSVAQLKSININISAENTPHYVNCDAETVKAVIRNLLSNAIKYSPENKEITISIQKNENEEKFSVIDKGIGISDENKTKIFNETQHFSTFGTNGEEGSGLGLLLSQSLIFANRGKIFFSSQPNNGSTFTFSFPV